MLNKPTVTTEFKKPTKIADHPKHIKAGMLLDINAGWRNFRPVIDPKKCVKCLQCFLVCPDGVIDKSEKDLQIDYNYCKGCGVCAHECKFKAITMIPEEVK